MKFLYHTSIFCLLSISFNLNSQILIGEDPKEVKKDTVHIKLKSKNTEKRELIGSTELLFNSSWSNSDRKLVENGEKYGKPLGIRVDETKLSTWSYSLEFRNYLTKSIALQAGLSYLQNGERYDFKDTDTAYNYKSTYTYIAMPIRFMYYHGDKIRLIGGGSLIPAMLNKNKKTENWTDRNDKETSASLSTTTGYNSFIINASVQAGVQVKFSNSFAVYVMPEYRWQLNSSYIDYAAYKHFARVFQLNFGLVYQL